MLRLLLVFTLIVFLCSAWAVGNEGSGNVSEPELVWRMFEPSASYEAKGLVRAKGGGFLIALERASPTQSSDDRSGRDVALWKLDRWGTKVWEILYGGEGDHTIQSIGATDDGGLILAGRVRVVETYEDTPYVLRFDESGGVVWEKTASENEWWDLRSIIQCSDGGFMAAGITAGGPGGILYVLRMNQDGEKLWDNTLGPDLHVCDVVETVDSGFIVAGNRAVRLGVEDAFFVRFDASGNKVWEKTYGDADGSETTSSVGALSMVPSRDGGFIVTGYYTVYKIDGDGEMLWETAYEDGYNWNWVVARAEDGYLVTSSRSTCKIDEQ